MTIDPLLVDCSPWQTFGPERWADLAADPRFHGVILKATEGVGGAAGWQARSAAWFARHWPAVGAVRKEGLEFYRGAYHFLRLDSPGAAQADHFLRTIDAAGSWSAPLDLLPVVDVEEGSGNDAIVARRGAGIVSDTTHAFVARVRQVTGREVVLYTGGWLRSLGLRDRLGCAWLWLAAYTATLPAAWYEQLGFTRASLWGWQYCGGQGADLAGYPHTTPVGNVDISALTLPGSLAALRAGLWAERPAPSVCAAGPEG
jgi:GH25 family lysozyme M1 (1,4-beta-N-acetylmuramidase)